MCFGNVEISKLFVYLYIYIYIYIYALFVNFPRVGELEQVVALKFY